MKTLLAVLVVLPACLTSTGLAQQRYTAPGRVVFTSPGGFGNVAYPGIGASPQPSFSNRIGTRAGVVGRPNASALQTNGFRNSYVYAYPVYIGGGYAEQAQQPVNVTVVNAAPQVPNVIINQNFGPQQAPEPPQETTRIYRTPTPTYDEAAAATPQPKYYLVAFKDHSVYSAFAYWIEDKTLHYVTPQQTHNQASLDLIDLDLTKQLNQR